jgi:glycosyltransferase involved in cell wall biosynthesis
VLAKVKILRLIARMNVGGPAIQITGLMRNLPSDIFEQKLVTGFCDKDEIDYLEENQLNFLATKIEGFGRSVNLLSDLKVLLALQREIKTYNPDIIHTHTAKAGFLGRLASLLTFKRRILVHTFHGHLLHGYFSKPKTSLVIIAEKVLAQITNKLIAVGDQVRDDLLAAKIGNSKKYVVVGPGLELGELSEREPVLEYFNLPKNKFIVTWIGRVVAVKAPHRIIEIATESGERNLEVHFVVVGDGPLLSELRNLAAKMELPITFLGWQSNIEKILSFSDLVFLTSENEGTPVALIQAQMAGIPVISTDVGSAAEVMLDKQSGYCLDYSAEHFVDKIQMLQVDANMRLSFGAKGKENALQNFSLLRLIGDHASIYLELKEKL